MINIDKYYLDTFKVSKENLIKLIDTAISKGGSYADLYFENTTYKEISLKDGKVNTVGMHLDYGVGIRVLKGEKTGYAYTESTDMASMLKAAQAASTIATGVRVKIDSNSIENKPSKSYPGKPNPSADRYPVIEDWRNVETELIINTLYKLKQAIEDKDKRANKIIISISSQMSDILMFNSHLEMKYETRPLATIGVAVIFKENDKVVQSSASKSYRMGAEMISDNLIEELANSVTKNIDDKFVAKRPKGGQMPVVMGAGASGILLHEAMGHAFEADFNRKGQSIFCDKMGQKICNENITIVDDGTITANRGSLNFDDEGVPSQKTYMVENGILTSFLHDRISAKFYDLSPTGNGRRESFRYPPIPRMRSTYMESGDTKQEDIISNVKKGIFVDEFSNGQVKIGEGDFTFYVKSGYLIENGQLTQPIKDINIIGNGPEALADIIAVGNNLEISNAGWTCGKDQSVPVTCGMPSVLVRNLTVGGN